jgi:hypothetical protein
LTNPFPWNDINDVNTTTSSLVRAFPASEIKQLTKGGKNFDYIEANSVIDRLNEAFSPIGWSYSCNQIHWLGDPTTSRQLAVYGELSISTPWGLITKGQWGARTVMAQADSTKMDFGDDLKSAGSDALKKCATLFGIFNHGYRKGSTTLPDDAVLKETLTALRKLAIDKGLNIQQLFDICGGICRKTILGWADLSIAQARAVFVILKDMPKTESIREPATAA